MHGEIRVSSRYNSPQIIEHLANQYVLGTLTKRVRQRVETIAQSNNELADAIQYWQTKLINLDHSTDTLTPKQETWQEIINTIDAYDRENVVASVSHNPVVETDHVNEKYLSAVPVWQKIIVGINTWLSLPSYRYVSAFSILILTLLLSFTISKITKEDPLSYVAVLTENNGQAHMVASTYGHSKKLIINVINIPELDEEEDFELWVVSKTDQQVRSLGVLPKTQRLIEQQLTHAQWRLIKDSQSLLITKEEFGGSAIGEPSDAIVSQGLCVRLEKWDKNA